MRSGLPLLCFAAVAVSACGVSTRVTPAAGVASTRDGEIAFAIVEPIVRARLSATGAVTGDPLVALYRAIAEEIAVRRALVPEAGAETSEFAALGKARDKIHRQIAAQLYLEEASPPAAPPTDAEIRKAFEDQRERFRQPAQCFVWHLLLRSGPERSVEATRALASELKRQIEAGASFSDVAREHSQSETRSLGGRLGRVEQGKLPPALERIVFALPEGGVSEPVESRDGIMLFRATEVIPGKEFELHDVRTVLARELTQARSEESAEAVASRLPIDPADKILGANEMGLAFALGEQETLLRVDGLEWTRAELTEDWQRLRESLPPGGNFEFPDYYRRLAATHRVYRVAAAEGIEGRKADEISRRERQVAGERLFRSEIEAALEREAERSPAALRQFFEDNRYLYLTAPRLRIRSLSVAAGEDASSRLRELEAGRAELLAGRTSLDELADRLGAELGAPQWVSSAELAGFEPKVRYYLSEVGAEGFSVPFQLSGRVALIAVLEREEPAAQPFEAVADRVVDDYVGRHRKALYDAVAERILRDAGFEFHDALVREQLGIEPNPPS